MSIPIRRGATSVPATYIPIACNAAVRFANGQRKDGAVNHHATHQIPIQSMVFGDKEIRSETFRINTASFRGQEGDGPSSALANASFNSEIPKRFSTRAGTKAFAIFGSLLGCSTAESSGIF